MNQALFRAFYDKISQDEELMGYLNLPVTASSAKARTELDKKKLERIVKHYQTEYIKNLPRIVFSC